MCYSMWNALSKTTSPWVTLFLQEFLAYLQKQDVAVDWQQDYRTSTIINNSIELPEPLGACIVVRTDRPQNGCESGSGLWSPDCPDMILQPRAQSWNLKHWEYNFTTKAGFHKCALRHTNDNLFQVSAGPVPAGCHLELGLLRSQYLWRLHRLNRGEHPEI